MKTKYANWLEPDEAFNVIQCCVPTSMAIELTKATVAKKGNIYPNDKEALLDFIAIHWAWITEK